MSTRAITKSMSDEIVAQRERADRNEARVKHLEWVIRTGGGAYQAERIALGLPAEKPEYDSANRYAGLKKATIVIREDGRLDVLRERESTGEWFRGMETLDEAFEVIRAHETNENEDASLIPNYDGKLFNEKAGCEHEVVRQWSGVKCRKCDGWFCY